MPFEDTISDPDLIVHELNFSLVYAEFCFHMSSQKLLVKFNEYFSGLLYLYYIENAMKQLVLRDKGQEAVFRFVGILALLSLIASLILTDPGSWLFWLCAAMIVLLLIALFTHGFGTNINRLIHNNGVLEIRWYNRLRKRRINVGDIAGMTFDNRFVCIKLKNEKILRIPVKYFEPHDRDEIISFLKEISNL